MSKADALVVVSPEYNHGYSGLLKHVLDSCLKGYIHKALRIVGVSAGPFGGTRVIQNLLPVLREIGLVTIFWDVNFSSVQKVFAEDGRLVDESYIRRIDKFLKGADLDGEDTAAGSRTDISGLKETEEWLLWLTLTK
jgi:NAD(P)H-dependent FMN reductase